MSDDETVSIHDEPLVNCYETADEGVVVYDVESPNSQWVKADMTMEVEQ